MTRGQENHPDQRSAREPLLWRLLGEGESPVWWAIPLLAIRGCRLRLHVVVPVLMLTVLVYALWNGLGPVYVVTWSLALAAAVIWHEAARGHAFVRWYKARPADVTLWPLGAVWRTDPGTYSERGVETRAQAGSAIIGLAATAGLAIAAGTAVVVVTKSPELLTFDPIRPGMTLTEISGASTGTTLAMVALWQLYAAAVFLFTANLLPMLPLDIGLLLQAAAERRDGPHLAAKAGLLVAFVLFGGGLLTGLPLVAAVGACGGAYCWNMLQQARFALDPAGLDRWRAVLDAPGSETHPEQSPISEADREAVERILAKISAQGMKSLSRAERRTLREATDRLRGP